MKQQINVCEYADDVDCLKPATYCGIISRSAISMIDRGDGIELDYTRPAISIETGIGYACDEHAVRLDPFPMSSGNLIVQAPAMKEALTDLLDWYDEWMESDEPEKLDVENSMDAARVVIAAAEGK